MTPSQNQCQMNFEAMEEHLDVVAQMFTQSKSVLTALEAQLWTMEIARLGPDRLLSFAAFWMGGDAGVQRAPKVQDFRRYLDPGHLDDGLAWERLVSLVAGVGPYADPPNEDPRLLMAIQKLGGWVQVCLSMPDGADDYKLRQYRERFKGAWNSAQAASVQGVLDGVSRPLGLCSSPTQQRMLKFEKVEQGAQEIAAVESHP